MLVLARKQDQWIDIILPDGTEISLGALRVRGSQVRLAVDAPPEVAIIRREIRHIPDPKNGNRKLQM